MIITKVMNLRFLGVAYCILLGTSFVAATVDVEKKRAQLRISARNYTFK